MSSMNMYVRKFNTANAVNAKVVEKIGINNLDLYIPRIDEKHSEHDVKILFANFGIGLVDYVDFVATKDPETKQIKYYSAFLKLTEWNPDGYWFNQIIVAKENKIQISPFEFWVLLPAKTTISRSKVNTHQLAAYTDELFVKVETIEKQVNNSITVSSEHFKNLLAKSEEQASQIDKLMKIIEVQSKQLERVNKVLFETQVEEIGNRPRALTIEDLATTEEDSGNEFDGFKCKTCSMEFDTKKQLCIHSDVCEKVKPLPTYRFDDDDCFLSKPLTFNNWTETLDSKSGIIRGSFSVDLDEVLDSVVKGTGITKEEAKKQLEKEFADSQRANSSRNYCGNE